MVLKYNFNESINRLQTNSVKWDEVENLFGDKEILPMWVADMDFKSPQPVIEALKKRADHGIYGYTTRPDSYYEATVGWMKRRHNWTIEKDWITFTPGVVPALGIIVQSFTNPGDKIIIQQPVYYPFMSVIEKNGREIVNNPLRLENGRYYMDFEDLEKKIDPSVKMIIISNPHNPVGRVWEQDELTKLGEICLKHNILVVSDEIHSDLVYEGNIHTPFASISDNFAGRSITCTAPSKTFNLAGLQTSNMIIPNQELRERFNKALEDRFIGMTNTFGVTALIAAYEEGEEWLDQLLVYLKGNLDFLNEYIKSNIPEVKVIKPDATYLVWLDCRELGLDAKKLEEVIQKQGKVAFDEGYIFGKEGRRLYKNQHCLPEGAVGRRLKRFSEALKK